MSNLKKRKGSSLIMVLVLLLVVATVGAVTTKTIIQTTKANTNEKKTGDIVFVVESGLEYGVSWFNQNHTDGIVLKNKTDIVKGYDLSVKIEKAGADYKVVSEATTDNTNKPVRSKSASVIIKVTTTPSTQNIAPSNVGSTNTSNTNSGSVNIKTPMSIVTGSLGNITLPTSGSRTYNVKGVAGYNDNSNIYTLLRTYWPTTPQQSQTGQYTDSINVNYNNINMNQVSIGAFSPTTQFQPSADKEFQRQNIGGGTSIYKVEGGTGYTVTNDILYVDGNLSITPSGGGSVEQDLNQKNVVLNKPSMNFKKIVVKGDVNIITTQAVKLENFEVECGGSFKVRGNNTFTLSKSSIKTKDEIDFNNTSGSTISNTTLLSNNIKIHDSYIKSIENNVTANSLSLTSTSGIEMQKNEIKAGDLIINNQNGLSVDQSKIETNNVNIITSTTINFKKTNIKATTKFNVKTNNDLNFIGGSLLNAGDVALNAISVNVSGDASSYSKITAKNFDVNCPGNTFVTNKAIITADKSTIKANEVKVDYSGILVKEQNFNVNFKVGMNKSVIISDKVDIKNASQIEIGNLLSDVEFKGVIDEINKTMASGGSTSNNNSNNGANSNANGNTGSSNGTSNGSNSNAGNSSSSASSPNKPTYKLDKNTLTYY